MSANGLTDGSTKAFRISRTAWLPTIRSPVRLPPLLIFLHELNAGAWVERLRAFPGTRVVVSTEHLKPWSESLTPSALLLSRLEREEAEQLQAALPGVRATDLRRLPPNRLIFKQGSELCTVDMKQR